MTRSGRRALVAARNRLAARRLLRRTANAMLPPPPGVWAAYGANTILVPPTRVETPECIALGREVILHEHSWLLVRRLPDAPDPLLRIGDRTSFNRFVKIVCLSHIIIGADVLAGDRVYISDVEHLPWTDRIGTDRPLSAPRPVVIGDCVFLGIGCVIKPGVTIGEGAYVGAGAVVSSDIPAGGLVVGAPGRLVRLRNDATGEWERLP